jgi:signal transduction histidine kinase/CheY-like chemotaxis protein
MSGLWVSALPSFFCATQNGTGLLGASLESAWWFSLSLGILWVWVCVVVVASVSAVMLMWAIRQIRSQWKEMHKPPSQDPQGKVIGILDSADSTKDEFPSVNAVGSRKETPTPASELVTDHPIRESYRMAFEDLVEGFALHEVIRDPQGQPTDYGILDANAAFAGFLGLSHRQVVGRRLTELGVADLDTVVEKLRPVAQENRPRQFHWRCPATNKDLYVVSYGTSAGHVATLLLDVTEQIQAEKKSRELQEQLHHTRKMEAIGQLAGGIAHDFNNLLTAIHGNAELIRIDPKSDRSHMECAEQILQASHRMTDLTQQLLSFGRKGKLQTISVDMHEAIAETVKLLSHSIDRRIQIIQELRAPYPCVVGDPSQIKNSLLNLGINARDAMPRGGTLTFSTRIVRIDENQLDVNRETVQPGQYLEISVRDTGVGMDAATMEHIFEPFFTTKKIGEGTGLGLAGVYGCVKCHRGFINVESQPGQGSVFKVYFPPAESEVGVYASDGEGGAPAPKAKHILIIDDEQMVRNYAVRALRTLGYRVSFCGDGEEAADLYRDHYRDIDLVMLDLIMPRLDGVETFRKLKEINPAIRAVLISGYSDPAAIEVLTQEGVLGFIHKPFDIDNLARELNEYLEGAPTTKT